MSKQTKQLKDHWITDYFRINYVWEEFIYQFILDDLDCLNLDEFIWTCLDEWYYQCPSVSDRPIADKALELIEAIPFRVLTEWKAKDIREGCLEAINLNCECTDPYECTCRDIEQWVEDEYSDFVDECIREANPIDGNLLELDAEELSEAVGEEYHNV